MTLGLSRLDCEKDTASIDFFQELGVGHLPWGTSYHAVRAQISPGGEAPGERKWLSSSPENTALWVSRGPREGTSAQEMQICLHWSPVSGARQQRGGEAGPGRGARGNRAGWRRQSRKGTGQ